MIVAAPIPLSGALSIAYPGQGQWFSGLDTRQSVFLCYGFQAASPCLSTRGRMRTPMHEAITTVPL